MRYIKENRFHRSNINKIVQTAETKISKIVTKISITLEKSYLTYQ